MHDDYEVYREIWRVTEWRDGAIYKTEFVEKRWVPMGLRSFHKDGQRYIVSAISTSDPDNGTLPRRRIA